MRRSSKIRKQKLLDEIEELKQGLEDMKRVASFQNATSTLDHTLQNADSSNSGRNYYSNTIPYKSQSTNNQNQLSSAPQSYVNLKSIEQDDRERILLLDTIQQLKKQAQISEEENFLLKKQLDENEKLISMQRKEITDTKGKLQGLDIKVSMLEKKLNNELLRNKDLEQRIQALQIQLQNKDDSSILERQVDSHLDRSSLNYLEQAHKMQTDQLRGHQEHQLLSIEKKLHNSYRFKPVDKIDQNRAKRDEVSEYLDGESQLNVTAGNAFLKDKIRRNSSFVSNTTKRINQTQIINDRDLHDQSNLLNDSHNNKENDSQNQMIRLFPDRAIKASAFIDVFNMEKQVIRIKNPLKKLAQDVDHAQIYQFSIIYRVQDLLTQLGERNINLKLAKVKDLIYEIQIPTIQDEIPQIKTKLLKFGLSGNTLMVRLGGGYIDLLEYLDRQGFLIGLDGMQTV
ncbi:UNKNOWN [Stylonychia lemnae]|uniref:Uncharacterized protein n=1 Tax=Stylonychia lemnae TaxID=5949 RepID=A0A078AH60_STYLE|nr:UNKNOWN [Stylonychia lemnae]|eukprot:CDW81579.1 UNKNOWN [Stylonychia lemnae]